MSATEPFSRRPPARVLVVDDDAQVRSTLRRTYETAGWEVDEAGEGREALRRLYAHRPDAVLLDLVMNGVDGWETLQRIRDVADVPVVVVSGRHAELDKVRALRSGADDYLTKPFGRLELLARTEAVVRRSGHEPRLDEVYDDGAVRVDFVRRTVVVAGQEIALTPLEFRLLGAFVRHPGHVLSWTQLLEQAWPGGVGTRDQVKVYVGYLRRKLGPAGDLIATVRGFGYRYRERRA